MEAIEFVKQYKRICNFYSGKCFECPLFKDGCALCINSIERIIQIVEDWAYIHLQKTIIQDFFEKFPNAPKTVDGLPFPCPFECGYSKNNKCPFGKNAPSDDCSKCWFRPLED